jgi:hypothetical protein
MKKTNGEILVMYVGIVDFKTKILIQKKKPVKTQKSCVLHECVCLVNQERQSGA